MSDDLVSRLRALGGMSVLEAADMICQLRGNLTLAEEGLANYAEENSRLRQRCWALAFLLYPLEDGPREAVAEDLGWPCERMHVGSDWEDWSADAATMNAEPHSRRSINEQT